MSIADKVDSIKQLITLVLDSVPKFIALISELIALVKEIKQV